MPSKVSRGLSAGSPQSWFRNNRVNLSNYTDVIYNPLYDYQTKAATATQSQRFFQEPIGGPSGKTLVDTNMTLNGQIPKGQAFLITGVMIDFFPGVKISTTAVDDNFADDVYDFYKTGALVLTIGSKEWVFQAPLLKFPPVNKLFVDGATATTVAATTQNYLYSAACGRPFNIEPLLLESNQNFNVELQSTAALPSTNAGRVGVTLDGFLSRNAS